MRINAKIDYACRALLELSLHWPNSLPLQITVIARRQNIPMRFLTHILIQLKQIGLVVSVRGKSGGYILAKAPREITLRYLMQNFSEVQWLSSQANNQNRAANALEEIWQEAQNRFYASLEEITFEEIAQRQKKIAKVPMYTI